MDSTTTGGAGQDMLPGAPAPGFVAPSSTGRTLRLDDFLGKVPVALTFIGTLGTNEADELIATFNQSFAEFGRHLVQSLIVTPESRITVRRRRRTGTNIPLLADDEGDLLERYAASSTFPATVLIDTDGTVRRLIEGGNAHDHLAAVVQAGKEVRA